jgi:hypothetical protein
MKTNFKNVSRLISFETWYIYNAYIYMYSLEKVEMQTQTRKSYGNDKYEVHVH